MVRYCTSTKQPLQGIVYVDETGDFHEEFEHVSDPLIQKYLELRQAVGYISPLLKPSPLFSRLYTKLSPFSSNMTAPEFLPTMCMSLFDRLHSHFPHHQLVLSDFSALPESILGIDAPVVQTRYKGESIASSTLLVHPGWFDIFFPTNFEVMARIYEEIGRRRRKMRELSGEGEPTETTSSTSSVLTQQRFLKNYSPCLDATKTYLGENAILSFYDNMKFLLTK